MGINYQFPALGRSSDPKKGANGCSETLHHKSDFLMRPLRSQLSRSHENTQRAPRGPSESLLGVPVAGQASAEVGTQAFWTNAFGTV